MGKATLPKTMTTVAEQDSYSSAEEWANSIRALLDDQRLHEARRAAARAAEAHPGHPWLTQANRVLNPDRMVTRPAKGQGRKREFAWLRRNGDAYRQHWVALVGDRLIACAKTFQEMQKAIQGLELEGTPLLHYVD